MQTHLGGIPDIVKTIPRNVAQKMVNHVLCITCVTSLVVVTSVIAASHPQNSRVPEV